MTITDPTPVNGTIFVTDMLVNLTVVPFNTSFCNFGKSRLVYSSHSQVMHMACTDLYNIFEFPTYTAIVEPEIQNAGMTIVLSLELFLLTLAALLINSTKP